MYYDIRNVPYEYLELKRCYEQNNFEEALLHYYKLKDNYNNADNEYVFSDFVTPITMSSLDYESNGKAIMVEQNFPSINKMLEDSERMFYKIKRKRKI